jgi:CelD/BcsL family acetyltransferase involved in cellulose biosynthesis
LWILLARDEQTQKLVGIAPLFKTKVKDKLYLSYRQIGFIGSTHHHEYLNFIVQKGLEQEVIPKFIEFLQSQKHAWDTLQFSGIRGKHIHQTLLSTNLPWKKNNRANMNSPYIPLPADYDTWLMHTISKNHRKKLRRYERDLNQEFPGQWEIHRVTSEEELTEIFKVLVKLHQDQWENEGKPGAFNYGEWANYFYEVMQELLRMNCLRLFYLKIKGKPVTVLFSYKFGSFAWDYIAGIDYKFTDIPIGHVMTHHSIKTAIEEGLTEYCFMWGNQDYKFSFGAEKRTLHTYEYIQTPRVRMQKILIRFLRQIKRLIKKHPAIEPL